MLQKLTIVACEINGDQITPLAQDTAQENENVFKVMINPESYSRKLGQRFTAEDEQDDDRPINASKPTPRYKGSELEKLAFSFVLDGTGVLPDSQGVTVPDLLAKLTRIGCTYQGSNHEPNPVMVTWGEGLKGFFARVTDLTAEYVLFAPDGTPLRAKVKLNLLEAKTAAQVALESGDQSPDMTHLVQVRHSDTLPLLCHRIYKDAAKCLAVARFNDLDGFSRLTPGTLLRFPPMR